MNQNDILFENIIADFEPQKKITLKTMYLNGQRQAEIKHRYEMEKMKKEIIAEVLANLSIELETSKSLQKIKSLNEAIENLEKPKGGKKYVSYCNEGFT